jgi:hypothetical protein
MGRGVGMGHKGRTGMGIEGVGVGMGMVGDVQEWE